MSASNYHVHEEMVHENNKYSENEYVGYYSKKQFETISNKVVQITEVKPKKNDGSLFKDAHSVGAIDVFMYASQEPISQVAYNKFDTSNSCFQ